MPDDTRLVNRLRAHVIRKFCQVAVHLLPYPGKNVCRRRQPVQAYDGGYFHVDRGSFDVVELGMTAEGLPPDWGIQAIERTLKYERSRTALLTTDADGTMIRTGVDIDRCRHYSAESSLHFSSEAELKTSTVSRPAKPLPDDFIVESILETQIDS